MIRVLTTALTSADLLRAQAYACQKWLGEHQLTVVNDAENKPTFTNLWVAEMPKQIRQVSKEVGAEHIRFPQRLHQRRHMVFPNEPRYLRRLETANTRCADAVQYGITHLLKQSGEPILVLDADIAPIKQIDCRLLLKQKPIWGIGQNRGPIHYLWNGLLLFHPDKAKRMELFNVDCGCPGGTPVDVGGMLYLWLAANNGNIGYFARDTGGDWELYADTFLHLRGGGNWEYRTDAVARTDRFIEAIQQ